MAAWATASASHLHAVAAARLEIPARPSRGGVGVDAARALPAVGPPLARRQVRERAVELPRRALALETLAALAPKPSRQRTSQRPRSSCTLTARSSRRGCAQKCALFSRENSVHTDITPPNSRPGIRKPRTCRAFSMRATQVSSNQSCASDNLVAEVTKILASADSPRLGYLAKRLRQLRASDAQPRAIKSQRQRDRRPGWVMDAVVRVLADDGGTMRSMHVHAAVEQLLGVAVSQHSVSWCLASGVRRKEPRFERVSLGCYRLIRSS